MMTVDILVLRTVKCNQFEDVSMISELQLSTAGHCMVAGSCTPDCE